jgi:ABC-type multidrug transport system fused ATPase/permease subunit
LMVLFIGQGVFSYFRVRLFVDVAEITLAHIRNDVYKNLIRQPMMFFTQRRVGELTSRISADVSQIQDTFTSNLAQLVRQLITIVGGILMLFFVNIELALVMLAVVPVVSVVAFFFGKYIRKFSRTVQDKVADSNVIVEETLQGVQNVKSFANEAFEIGRYANSIETVKALAIKLGKVRGLFFSFIVTIMFGSLVFLLWYALGLVSKGEMTPGELTKFSFLTLFVGGSFGGIIEQYSQLQKALGATDRVLEILDETPEDIGIEEKPLPAEYKINGNVVFENVGFNYPSRPDFDVLKNISLTARAGEKIALVGPSGAGKSTIVSLLLRFYEPQNGQLLFDGKKSADIPLTFLRRQMAIVPQDVFLFGGTIKENILYGKHNATDADVIEAARQANAHDFIMSFPEGYDTLVGERGVKLSGGQRQRIAIARAVLKNPTILLLDEATSSLDSESEHLVQEALETLMQGRTSFIIAHRLSTIRSADKIIVIEKGGVIEQGSHNELLNIENGLYKRLSTMQFEGELFSNA